MYIQWTMNHGEWINLDIKITSPIIISPLYYNQWTTFCKYHKIRTTYSSLKKRHSNTLWTLYWGYWLTASEGAGSLWRRGESVFGWGVQIGDFHWMMCCMPTPVTLNGFALCRLLTNKLIESRSIESRSIEKVAHGRKKVCQYEKYIIIVWLKHVAKWT